MQRRLYTDEAHTALDIFRFAVFFQYLSFLYLINNRIQNKNGMPRKGNLGVKSLIFFPFCGDFFARPPTKTREFPTSGVTFIVKMCYPPYPIQGPFYYLGNFFLTASLSKLQYFGWNLIEDSFMQQDIYPTRLVLIGAVISTTTLEMPGFKSALH